MNYELVTFGDKEKKLLFDFNALSLFEEVYGDSLINAMSDETKFGFRMIHLLYYAGLKNGRDAGITKDLTGKLLYKKMTDEGLGLEEIMKPILKAIDKSGIFKGAKFEDELEELEAKNE